MRAGRRAIDRRPPPQRITPPGDRAHVPEHPPVPEPLGARQRAGSRCQRADAQPSICGRHASAPASTTGKSEEVDGTGRERLLELFGLERHAAARRRRSLPYGEQRRLEIARALATEPKVLLLDEPAAGMNPQEKAELMALIRRIRDEFASHPAHRARHEAW